MGFYKPVEGDRVRVVLEGEALLFTETTFLLGVNRIVPHNKHVMSVEKIEPPVVTFKPGDVVRSLDSGGVFALGKHQYLAVGGEGFTPWKYDASAAEFTSAEYELVELK